MRIPQGYNLFITTCHKEAKASFSSQVAVFRGRNFSLLTALPQAVTIPCGPRGLSFRPQGQKNIPFEDKHIELHIGFCCNSSFTNTKKHQGRKMCLVDPEDPLKCHKSKGLVAVAKVVATPLSELPWTTSTINLAKDVMAHNRRLHDENTGRT